MMTKFYIDEDSNYLGGWCGSEPPEGAIEVPFAPSFAHAKWNGVAWDGDEPKPENLPVPAKSLADQILDDPVELAKLKAALGL